MNRIIVIIKKIIKSGLICFGIEPHRAVRWYEKTRLLFRITLVDRARIFTGVRNLGLDSKRLIGRDSAKKHDSPPPGSLIRVMTFLKLTRIKFNSSAKPCVSIIIPVFNKFEFTFACLKSISKNKDGTDFEVVIVDDCSSDFTAKMLKKIKGIRAIRNSSNLGFIGSCNYGAGMARGDHLVFLNNDTVVTAGWLSALMQVLDTVPGAGMAGAKLIFPNGQLQEAGGIIFRDGSAMNFGRGDDPHGPQYEYLREADYCSGACLALSRELFLSLGGFDDRFRPAYYEDVDLAFKIRQAGKKVLYQPRAEIIHFEGITSGTDLSSGTKKYQRINQENFREKWKAVLDGHHEYGVEIFRDRDRYANKRILVIDVAVCMPDKDAGSLRMLNILKILAGAGHKISFYPDNRYYEETYVRNMQNIGVEVLAYDSPEGFSEHLRLHGREYDVVVVSRLDVALNHVDQVRHFCPQAYTIFDTVDLHYVREMRAASVANSSSGLEEANKRKREELSVAAKADLTLVVSPVEKELLMEEDPSLPVSVLSLVFDSYGRAVPFEMRKDIMFIGGFLHKPNVDAVQYFVREIFPRIREAIPGIKFYVVGSNPPDSVLSLSCDDIIVTGYVEDDRAIFDRCRLSVAPLRFGAGVKGKITSSMSYGVPVVATPLAVEGMFLKHEENVMVALSPEEFSDAVVRLYTDEKLWNDLSDNGLKNISEKFSFEVARQSLDTIINGR